MKAPKHNRREFVKKSSLGLMGLTLLPSLTTKVAASDRLRVAHIGVGGMGNNHMKWFAGLDDVEVVALCDVDELHLADSLKTLESLQPGSKVSGYKDFRKILDRKDIDAITCATPDHWHSQIASLAFQAGKDVYGEKPLSYDVKEGQLLLKNQQKYNRIFQLGTQIHATDNYHRVVELIQAGAIGKVHTVRLWKTGGPPDLTETVIKPIPKTLDWDMWLGPAPYVDYIPAKCHFTYRYFMDYSGGVFADFWCHIADVVYWAIQPKGLKSISARGEEADGIANTPKWIDVDYEFQDLKLFWTSTPPDVPGAAKRGIGAYFEGEKGTLICDYETREITINGETVTDIPEIPKTLTRSPGHQQNFVDAVKSRKPSESNLAYAREMTLPMHLGLISWQLNRKLAWNAEKEKFIGDKEANALLSRKPRKKWDLT
ncbi:Gfo/Idh/MocA family oxidoreductase [uncultured Eudoraea sp.]|jgi:predicted dehydrogenase|uniref:Gfo/Idh/MocA family protein n=1 Tax=uncultured Eudoraea sp. TaxID=1035614 RepID=UPI0026104560|nr:Gfo/Idh/MocA family oxidoreductase [uncultured Eudoraea sp.]